MSNASDTLPKTHGEAHGTVDPHKPAGQSVWLLAFGALGVVYGDIGTSPLYAVKECFNPEFGLAPTPDNVIGICSLFFWTIFFVVIVKYVFFVMRADNKGEGGNLALLALTTQRQPSPSLSSDGKTPGQLARVATKGIAFTALLGLIGTGLLGADGTITPAISVLSAIEGLEIATPSFRPFVIPITLVILFGIFTIQKRGTARISVLFAPAMLVWFLSIALIAIPHLAENPGIFAALNPFRGIKLLVTHGFHGFLVLGAVVLCITGAEALYADMGHFGRKAISYAWYPIVFPSLVLNYFGQGAHIIKLGASAAANPFYGMAPDWAIYPMVAISTVATIIASQALISGSFSLAQQAVQLGYSPRLTIVHTSGEHKGQIYIPEINFLLMVACIGLVLVFRSSSDLAAAYGIAVMGTMTITSILIHQVAIKRWGWKPLKAHALLVALLLVDIPFLTANVPKVVHGGWFPLVICAVVFSVMVTWKRGRTALVRKLEQQFYPVQEFVKTMARQKPHRVDGTAIFMTSNPRVAPPALMHHFTHTQVLHGQVLLLSIVTEDVPVMPMKDVIEVTNLGVGFYEVIAHFGFMQTPKVEKILRLCRVQAGINYDDAKTTFFLGRDILLINGPERMARWRKILFAFLVRNSLSATAYYGFPPDRVVELGMKVNL
jgi:KUP system potassium uptake protein